MKEGDIILASLPQANGKLRDRPALVLREIPPYRDLLVCGISTQLHQYVKNFDEIISLTDVDFKLSGLQTASLIRLGFLVVLPCRYILGSIGSVSSDRHKRLLKTLSDYLIKEGRWAI